MRSKFFCGGDVGKGTIILVIQPLLKICTNIHEKFDITIST